MEGLLAQARSEAAIQVSQLSSELSASQTAAKAGTDSANRLKRELHSVQSSLVSPVVACSVGAGTQLLTPVAFALLADRSREGVLGSKGELGNRKDGGRHMIAITLCWASHSATVCVCVAWQNESLQRQVSQYQQDKQLSRDAEKRHRVEWEDANSTQHQREFQCGRTRALTHTHTQDVLTHTFGGGTTSQANRSTAS